MRQKNLSVWLIPYMYYIANKMFRTNQSQITVLIKQIACEVLLNCGLLEGFVILISFLFYLYFDIILIIDINFLLNSNVGRKKA